jgi:hypothetical protein
VGTNASKDFAMPFGYIPQGDFLASLTANSSIDNKSFYSVSDVQAFSAKAQLRKKLNFFL